MSRHEIGIDLVDIDRIIGVLERFPNRFRERVLTEAVARYCGNKVDRIAGRWAAKEAWERFGSPSKPGLFIDRSR